MQLTFFLPSYCWDWRIKRGKEKSEIFRLQLLFWQNLFCCLLQLISKHCLWWASAGRQGERSCLLPSAPPHNSSFFSSTV